MIVNNIYFITNTTYRTYSHTYYKVYRKCGGWCCRTHYFDLYFSFNFSIVDVKKYAEVEKFPNISKF